MSLAEAPPTASYKIVRVKRRGQDGVAREVPESSMIVGVPGGPPGEEGIVLCAPPDWHVEDEIVLTQVGHPPQDALRKFTRVRWFKGTARFPTGLDVGMIGHYVQGDHGQPWCEATFPQISPDAYDRLLAFAEGRPYFGMHERRRIAKETEDFLAQRGAGMEPTAPSPAAAEQAVLDDRLKAMVERLVAERLAAERGQKK